MLAWVVRTAGNHAIAGIWHEDTDLNTTAARIESGRSHYAPFAGLAASNGASAAHLSEKEAVPSVTAMPATSPSPPNSSPKTPRAPPRRNRRLLDRGRLHLRRRPRHRHRLHQRPGHRVLDRRPTQPSLLPLARPRLATALPLLPAPERKPLKTAVLSDSPEERIELRQYPFTKIRFTLIRKCELAALRVNPSWSPHDLYAPARPEDGGPFVIGRVIHSGRGVGFTGWIGAVAVFHRTLSPAGMKRLSALGRSPIPARQ